MRPAHMLVCLGTLRTLHTVGSAPVAVGGRDRCSGKGGCQCVPPVWVGRKLNPWRTDRETVQEKNRPSQNRLCPPLAMPVGQVGGKGVGEKVGMNGWKGPGGDEERSRFQGYRDYCVSPMSAAARRTLGPGEKSMNRGKGICVN